MDKKRLIIGIIVVIVEIILMALLIRYFLRPFRAYDPKPGLSSQKVQVMGNTAKDENVMKIVINNESYTIQIENKELMEKIYNVLPESFTMKDLNSNEKYYYMEKTIENVDSNYTGEIKKGDVMLYDNNCVVVFYDNFTTEYKYAKIGHIDNLGDIGSSDVEVSITK